ncbi:MAG: indoleamine 2,3-dioxygenase [Sphingomonas sp.]|uniref:indoleamine 2,3-dioxygenase n=1 Tax=Sphingomonas sp. TaxID=28214 RepID=UPI0035A8332C|nr:indoleamine 2,3-dioxygenase [Sphingomonas sp.]
MHDLGHFGLARDRGFLSAVEIDDVLLPDDFAEVEDAAAILSGLVTTGRVRHWLNALPLPDIDAFLASADEAAIGVAMVRYSFLVQAYVWGEPTPPEKLPANLAIPFVALSDAIGFPPVMNYAGYVLDNWFRLDKSGPIALDNLVMDQHFAGGQDENWFVLIHVAIEAVAGRALALGVDLVRASDAGDAAQVEALLIEMNSVWDEINAIFDRMVEKCDPYIYFNRVRPYINGWKNNPAMPDGLIYEGVARFGGKPQPFRGQTGSQSSIVPTMDALFQVTHTQDELRDFLAELHHYRPRKHRAFIEEMQAASHLRDFAKGQPQSLKDAFNACVEQVARFRSRHLEYAAAYINKQASHAAGNDPDVGTGGTPFMKYLKKHRDENRAQII